MSTQYIYIYIYIILSIKDQLRNYSELVNFTSKHTVSVDNKKLNIYWTKTAHMFYFKLNADLVTKHAHT